MSVGRSSAESCAARRARASPCGVRASATPLTPHLGGYETRPCSLGTRAFRDRVPQGTQATLALLEQLTLSYLFFLFFSS